MASTTFTDNSTLIVASWLQDVNTVVYSLFGNGTSYTGTLTLTGLVIDTGGATNLSIKTNNGTEQLRINHTASVDRYLTITGGVSGSATFATLGAVSGGVGFSTRIDVQQTSDAGVDSATITSSAATATNQFGAKIKLSGDPNDTTRYFLTGVGNTTNRIYIMSNGNLQNTNNSYGAISDRKLKRDIALAGSQWEDVKALARTVSKFALKTDPTKRMIGFVAQDIEPISPGLVYQSDDLEEVDGEQRSTGTVTMGVHYSIAYMKAFKALGEALERIEALEGRIN